jgi:asparagine synthetase B (glutamine-hydrolysing)
MGLAPYGNPGVDLGHFISLNHAAHRLNAALLFERNNGTSAIAKRLGPERTPESEIDDSFKNIAFAVRDACEAAQMAVKMLFLDRDVRELVSPTVSCSGYHYEAREHLAYGSKQVENEDLRERLAFMDIHTHLEPRLLRDLDAMSMAHSIEVRSVFLDHRLVEFLQTVPSSFRMRQKRLLLDAVKAFLPSALLADLETRRKRTFTFPFQRWLSRDLRGAMKDTFAPDRLRSMGILEPAALNRL